MRRLIYYITLLLITFNVNAQMIKPFGNICWDDSYTSTAQKMISMPGIEEAKVTYFYRSATIKEADSRGISGLPEILLNQPTTLTSPVKPNYKLEQYVEMRTGSKYPYISNGRLEVTVYPVIICDVPFKLTATFEPNAGLFLYNPHNSIMVNKDRLVPFVLRSVKLSSKSKALGQRKDAVSHAISKKYFKGKAIGSASQIKDKTGTIFSVQDSTSQYVINYGALYGSGYFQNLQKAYSEYVSKQEVKGNQAKQDLSAGL